MRGFWVEHRLKERSELRLGVNSRNIVSVLLTMSSEGRWYPQERWKQMSSLFSRILLFFRMGGFTNIIMLYMYMFYIGRISPLRPWRTDSVAGMVFSLIFPSD